MKFRGLLHKQKGGHLPLSIQSEVTASLEGFPERMSWNVQFDTGGVLWVKTTADKCKWAVMLVVYHKCAPLAGFITCILDGCDE